MGFLGVELYNFKTHKETKIGFKDAETILAGPNGVGKTSVLEGIIWALTGKDLDGNGDPKRYISLDSERATVILNSPKFTLQRTISRKSSQQAKIMLSGWDRYEPVSQEELDKKFGADFRKFSSIINVGYFMNQSPRDRRDILRSFVNTGTLKENISEILGEQAPEIANVPYLDQKKDLKTLTSFRIQKEKELAATEAALHEQKTVLGSYNAEGDVDALTKRKVVLEKQIRGIEDYVKEKRAYDYSKSVYDSERRAFEEAAKNRAALQNEYEIACSNLELMQEKRNQYVKALEAIESQKPKVDYLPLPEKPMIADMPNSEFCQGCGQKITDRTKLSYEKRRQEMMAMYEQKVSEANAFNLKSQRLEHEWQTKVKAACAEIDKIDVTDAKIKIGFIKSKAEQWGNVKEPVVPREPQTTLDISQLDFMKREIVEVSGKIQSIIATQSRREMCLQRIAELEESKKKVGNQVYFYTRMEEAFKKVPGHELRKIRNAAEIQGYELIILERDGEPEGIDYAYKGVPWVGLSKGEKIRLSCLISERLSKLMSRPDGTPLLEFFFVDDHELLDSQEVIKRLPGQRIIAKVDHKGWMVS